VPATTHGQRVGRTRMLHRKDKRGGGPVWPEKSWLLKKNVLGGKKKNLKKKGRPQGDPN